MDSVFGRFCVSEERPFCDHLPESKRKVTITDTFLRLRDYDVVNLTQEIKKMYIESIDRFCIAGDDGQYGSSAEHDVYALQALSRRVHYGAMYVAETKYQSDPEQYQRLIKSRDTQGMDTLLTRKDIEDTIIERVREKVMRIQGFVNQTVRRIVDPEVFISLYRNHIIPLTKKGEIIYLLNREDSNAKK
jgi:chorismate mutase